MKLVHKADDRGRIFAAISKNVSDLMYMLKYEHARGLANITHVVRNIIKPFSSCQKKK
jgi:hypothetical protein